MTGLIGPAVGENLNKMANLRMSTGINMYETIFGFTPMSITRECHSRSLEVGIQPYITREDMLLKFGYWQRRMENEADSMRNEAEELGLKLPADDAEDTTTYETKGEGHRTGFGRDEGLKNFTFFWGSKNPRALSTARNIE